mmetsp:Transcript_28423/g.49257  ORF Transcript_28423/g.49257 Transcript_28423/m.49257 type:complete len:125 (-) Transcript_28423:2226-2600(-)
MCICKVGYRSRTLQHAAYLVLQGTGSERVFYCDITHLITFAMITLLRLESANNQEHKTFSLNALHQTRRNRKFCKIQLMEWHLSVVDEMQLSSFFYQRQMICYSKFCLLICWFWATKSNAALPH